MFAQDLKGTERPTDMVKTIYQSSRSRKIVRESRINEIKHVQNEKPLREFTHKYHRKKKRLQAR